MIDPPTPRHQHTLVSHRKDPKVEEPKIKYLFGGITTPDNKMYNDVWMMNYENYVADPNDDTIEGIKFIQLSTQGERPSPRKGHTAFCYQGAMYVFGGETINYGENTTSKIYILSLQSPYNWTSFDSSLSKITARSLFSSSWLNSDSILFFGGLENDTATGINDLIYLDLKNMHFSFPFTAGEYPTSRYGHATCSYPISSSLSQKGVSPVLLLIGGIDYTFTPMTIHSLMLVPRTDKLSWERLLPHSPYSLEVANKAQTFAFEARTHNLSLKDLLIEEKSKGGEVRKIEMEARKEYDKISEKWKRRDKDLQKKIEEEESRCEGLLNEVQDIMQMIKCEQYLEQVLSEKGELLEENFRKIQEYMGVCDTSFVSVIRSKPYFYE